MDRIYKIDKMNFTKNLSVRGNRGEFSLKIHPISTQANRNSGRVNIPEVGSGEPIYKRGF